MPYVTAIATAPPTTSRPIAGAHRAPPREALNAPVNANASSTTANVTATLIPDGADRIATIGRIEPTVNATADDTAACHGLVKPCRRAVAVSRDRYLEPFNGRPQWPPIVHHAPGQGQPATGVSKAWRLPRRPARTSPRRLAVTGVPVLGVTVDLSGTLAYAGGKIAASLTGALSSDAVISAVLTVKSGSTVTLYTADGFSIDGSAAVGSGDTVFTVDVKGRCTTRRPGR